MPTPALSEALRLQTLEAFRAAGGNKSHAAARLGLPIGTFASRLIRALEMFPNGGVAISGTRIPQRVRTEVRDGVVMAFSDAHFSPHGRSVAHAAFMKLAPRLKPVAVLDVGDTLDGASISRHPMTGNDDLASPQDEIFACLEQRGEMMEVCPGARLYWVFGNHDTRHDAYIAKNAEKMRGIKGMTLAENLPGWKISYGLEINWNTDPILVIHNYKGGVHSSHNNALSSGVHFISGHDHAQTIARYTNERGTMYGINPGVFADPDAPTFRYTFARPKNWRSGLAVLTFRDGRLLPPELVEVVRGIAYFRGEQV